MPEDNNEVNVIRTDYAIAVTTLVGKGATHGAESTSLGALVNVLQHIINTVKSGKFSGFESASALINSVAVSEAQGRMGFAYIANPQPHEHDDFVMDDEMLNGIVERCAALTGSAEVIEFVKEGEAERSEQAAQAGDVH